MTTPHRNPHDPQSQATGPAPRPQLRGPGRLADLTAIQAHWLNLDGADTELGNTDLIDRLWLVVADVPVLLAETERLHRLLRIARRRLADLLAAVRTALAAAAEGDPQPLTYILDELDSRDPLPRRWGGR